MAFNARKLEMVLKEVNADLDSEGVLTERLTQDIWTKLMSNLMQVNNPNLYGEYLMAIPIRQELQKHIRSKRPDKIYTFNQIIHRLDEILDRYIPPPDLTGLEKENNQKIKKGKQKQITQQKKVEDVKQIEADPYTMKAIHWETKPLKQTSTTNMAVQTSREMKTADYRTGRHDRETAIQTSKVSLTEATTQVQEDIAVFRKDEAIETDRENRSEEDEISREQYLMLKANQSVLMKTVDDQQMKIKILEESVTQLERKNVALLDELQSVGAEKGEKIDVYSKVEREIRFLRNELKIKEKTLQLSLIERNELLDRLSSVTSSKMANGKTNMTDLSDVLRPTQIADKFSKLFDSEWTDAFHLLTLDMKEEKTVINWLLEILLDCYWFCVNTNESHTKLMVENLLHPFKRSSATKVVDLSVLDNASSQLLINLKQYAASYAVSQIQVQFLQTMQRTKKQYYAEKTAKKLESYIDRCIELCWYMVTQDPAVVLDDKLPKAGDEFDRDVYRFHTKSGSKIEYVVWPALYIGKGGYLLLQGVAQPKQEGVALRIASSNSSRSVNF